MQLDTEYLRRHYASLSDEELHAMDRADLVEAAQRIYDEEVRARKLSAPPQSASRPPYQPEEDVEAGAPSGDDAEPGWLEDAAEAFSRYVSRGTDPTPDTVDACDALQAARIPCHLEMCEEAAQDGEVQYRWRVLVPGKLVHRAIGVLDRDIFNAEFEAQWRAHLEMLSDPELRVMEPQYAFCGLYDRIERINRAYDEELKRRRLE
jgi:hypothetical protein